MEPRFRQLDLIGPLLWVAAAGLALLITSFFIGLSAALAAKIVVVCAFGAATTWAWTFLLVRHGLGSGAVRRVGQAVGLALASLSVGVLATRLELMPLPVMMNIDGSASPIPFHIQFVRNWIIFGWIHLLYGAMAAAFLARDTLEVRERALAAARHEAQAAQVAALRAQVNPHFLFNALNTATALIELKRPDDARVLLLRLGDYFRASLAADPQPFASLQDEFDAVEAYLQIEMARYGERLRLETTLPEALRELRLPSAILQPLAENAIRHGAAQAEGVVTIALSAHSAGDDLTVQLTDDAAASIRAPEPNPGAGVGLANVAARLAAHYGERARLAHGREGSRFRVALTLPIELARAPDARPGR